MPAMRHSSMVHQTQRATRTRSCPAKFPAVHVYFQGAGCKRLTPPTSTSMLANWPALNGAFSYAKLRLPSRVLAAAARKPFTQLAWVDRKSVV